MRLKVNKKKDKIISCSIIAYLINKVKIRDNSKKTFKINQNNRKIKIKPTLMI